MRAWAAPEVPRVPGSGPPLRLHDTSTGAPFRPAAGEIVGLYVCGITPYDATHLGHAATYVTFDVVNRVLRDAGHTVRYVQNITDVDDPLLERAARDQIDWRELAAREIQLFRDDMTALRVIPPEHYAGVVERLPEIERAVTALVDAGQTYRLRVESEDAAQASDPAVPGRTPEVPGGDVYLDLSRQPSFGTVSGWSPTDMMRVFADRGGDPDRPGKRTPFDPLLWRAARPGEPSWDSARLGPGRPGWHIECTSIALDLLDNPFDVQGGGTDLVFPHHEMSAVQAAALTGDGFARGYVHQAMVGLDGEKMSKSRGNLVLVSRLRRDGVDPMAIRLALLAHHYRRDWEYTDDVLAQAQRRLECWRLAVSTDAGGPATATVETIRERLADDLDTPGAIAAVDAWSRYLSDDATAGEAARPGEVTPSSGVARRERGHLLSTAVDALLGVRLGVRLEDRLGARVEVPFGSGR